MKQDIKDLLNQSPAQLRKIGLKRWALLKCLPSYGVRLKKKPSTFNTWDLRGEFKVPRDIQEDESMTKAYVERVREEMRGLAVILGQVLLKTEREDVLVDSYVGSTIPNAFVVRFRIDKKSEVVERRKVLKHLFDALYWRNPCAFKEELEHYWDPKKRMLNPARLEKIPAWMTLKKALVEKGYMREDYLPLVSFTVLDRAIKEAIGPLPRGAPAKCIVCGANFWQTRKDKKTCSAKCRMKLSRIRRMVREALEELDMELNKIPTREKMEKLITLLKEKEKRRAPYAKRFGKEPEPIPWEGLIQHILRGGS